MITLEEYKNIYGNNTPIFDYPKDKLFSLFSDIQEKAVQNWRSFEPLKEGLRSFSNHIVKNKAYYQFVYKFFPNYFDVFTKKYEPLSNVFKDDNRLQKSIDMYNRYYGAKENFDLNYFIKPVSMSSNVYKAGNFSPVVAKYIYDNYTKDGETVFDFSSGFGGRMLGAMASKRKIHYEGIDPHPATYRGLCDLYSFFETELFLKYNSCNITKTSIEEFQIPDNLKGKVSICFSSPPFYDLELYSKEEELDKSQGQASYSYKTKEEFMEGFFGAVTSKCYDMLKDNGLLIVNMKDSERKKTVKSFLAYMKTTNFVESDHILMHMNNMTHGTSLGKNTRKEPIFVFKKKGK